MLVLSRKIGERIIITLPDGREVVVTVIDKRYKGHDSKQVRLGFDAPRDVQIDREEVARIKDRG